MLKLRDLYTQVETSSLTSDMTVLGQAIIQYEVRSYTDTRNLGETRSYVLTCTQRLVMPNPAQYTPQAGSVLMYSSYPALISANVAISDPDNVIASRTLLDYFPRTLNTSVATSQNTSDSTGSTVTQQYTAGSSTSQTNTFGTSASVGFMGEALTGDLSGSYSHSTTTDHYSSHSHGTSVDHGSQLSNSSSMSVKDWGSYAQVDAGDLDLTWIWGQEYPWNVIQFKSLNADGTSIVLPAFVQQRLVDENDNVYPPSELSLFGVDFVSRAAWLITPNGGLAGSETIQFTHSVTYGSGSHGLLQDSGGNSQFTAMLDTNTADPIVSTTLDLPLLALDPVTGSAPAVIGFMPNRFDVAPSQGAPFAITADANDLLVRGSGFTSVMATDFSAGPVQMTVYFKVTDANQDLNLSLKNWVMESAPCQLTIEVNGQATLTRYVDVPETGSGGDNTTVVALRYKDFTSASYCDYLQMGLNTVSVTVAPVDSSSAASYHILAMAVG